MLLDLFRTFDGGVAGLASASGVNMHTLYRVARGGHRRLPVRQLRAVAPLLQDLTLLGDPVDMRTLQRLWEEARSDESNPNH